MNLILYILKKDYITCSNLSFHQQIHYILFHMLIALHTDFCIVLKKIILLWLKTVQMKFVINS